MNRKFPYRYRVLVLLFFLTLITYLDRTCISLVGMRIKSDFKLSNTEFGWVLAAFSLANALFEIPSGAWGDRIGQRSILIRIVLWWSFFTALTGLTTGLITLMAVRFLFGMGEAGTFPNCSGVISHWFPVKETAKGISSSIIGLNAGAAIAPFIVIPIAASFGWRASFFVNGFIGLGGLGISFFFVAFTSSNVVVAISLVVGYFASVFNGIVAFSVCVDIGGNRVGTVAGIMNFCGQVGAFLLAIVFGKIADYTHNFDTSIYVLAFVLCMGGLFWLAVDPRKKIIAEEERHSVKLLEPEL